jgi:uncharacterized protein
MRALALPAIRFYQRRLSPYKGFCCAYRVHTGGASCSMLGLRAIRRYGLLRGLIVLRERLRRCGVAHRRYGAPERVDRGSCDAPCDVPCGPDCDLPDSKCGKGVRILECCDGCEWPQREGKRRDKRKRRRGDDRTHLPRRDVAAALD